MRAYAGAAAVLANALPPPVDANARAATRLARAPLPPVRADARATALLAATLLPPMRTPLSRPRRDGWRRRRGVRGRRHAG
eukprot:11077119-Alexandrium_andersonii.AAC.1